MPDPRDSRSGASAELTRVELANRIIRTRLVADHWRKAALAWDRKIDARIMAHPLCCVLGALNGGTRPEDLGVGPESDEGKVLRAMEMSHSESDLRVAVLPVERVEAGQTIWAHNDNDWLIVREIEINSYGDVIFLRRDGSEASFSGNQKVLVRL